jgi:inorganic pyrophosphatase/exopolyphosphatase
MQAQKKHLFEYDQIVVLGGSTYTSIVSNVFSEIGISIKKPLSGLTLGYAIKKIKNAVKQNSPIDC